MASERGELVSKLVSSKEPIKIRDIKDLRTGQDLFNVYGSRPNVVEELTNLKEELNRKRQARQDTRLAERNAFLNKEGRSRTTEEQFEDLVKAREEEMASKVSGGTANEDEIENYILDHWNLADQINQSIDGALQLIARNAVNHTSEKTAETSAFLKQIDDVSDTNLMGKLVKYKSPSDFISDLKVARSELEAKAQIPFEDNGNWSIPHIYRTIDKIDRCIKATEAIVINAEAASVNQPTTKTAWDEVKDAAQFVAKQAGDFIVKVVVSPVELFKSFKESVARFFEKNNEHNNEPPDSPKP